MQHWHEFEKLNGISSSFPPSNIIPVSSNKEPNPKQFQTRVPPVVTFCFPNDDNFTIREPVGKRVVNLRMSYVPVWAPEPPVEFFCG